MNFTIPCAVTLQHDGSCLLFGYARMRKGTRLTLYLDALALKGSRM